MNLVLICATCHYVILRSIMATHTSLFVIKTNHAQVTVFLVGQVVLDISSLFHAAVGLL